MSKKKGYVKFYRSTQDHWLWQDKPFSKGQAWADLMLSANHAPAKFDIKGQLVRLNRGDQARSQLTLSKAWGWSRGKVERFLVRLEEEGMIIYKTSQLTTVISICNYSEFQDLYTGSEATNEQQTNNRQGTNKKNKRIIKNVELEPARSYPQEEVIALYIKQRLQDQKKLINEKPDLKKWALDVVELMDINKTKDYQHVIELFDWANNHNFWGNKILSPSGLNKHFKMLEKQRTQRPYLQLPANLNELTEFANKNDLPKPAPGVTNLQYEQALKRFIRENNIFKGVKGE
jgi:hypothetical protein